MIPVFFCGLFLDFFLECDDSNMAMIYYLRLSNAQDCKASTTVNNFASSKYLLIFLIENS